MTMGISSLKVPALSFWSFILVIVSTNGAAPEPLFPAMFVFGDSIVDNGNNNYLNTLAKANYFPYGIDFNQGPTGRFCNGKTIVDFLGDLVGLPYLPPFVETYRGSSTILRGVNYASAAGGIMEETGQNLGGRFSLSQQVQNFETTLRQLKNQMNEHDLSQYLAKSLMFMIPGSNDYINNYLLPGLYPTSYIYDPKTYADLLIKRYATQILALQSLGLRKFLLVGIGPLGCIPNQRASGLAPPGKCVSFVNNLVEMFNVRLRSLADKLNSEHKEAIFVYGNTYGALLDIINKPKAYGFSVTDRGCCGIGRNQGQITCLPLAIPCRNRDQYVFWDAFHPTQAANKFFANKAFSGPPSDCYPINVKQMAQI